jgi:hypothetical protein
MQLVRGIAVWFAVSISAASAATLVGVNFGAAGSPSPTNWTLMTAPGTINNLIDSTGAPTAISLAVSATPPPPENFSGTPVPSTIPSDAPTLANLQSNISSYNGTPPNDLLAQFSGLTPNGAYSVYAIGFRVLGGINQSVTITGSGAPVAFSQIGPVFSLFFNGSIGSSSRTLESYAVPIQASGSGTISIQFNSGPQRYTVGGVALSFTPSIPTTPVPSSLVLVLIGLAAGGLFYLARRRNAARYG